MRPRSLRLLLAVLLLTAIGCGDDLAPGLPNNVQLHVWNQSEFELLELYVTPGVGYVGTENQLVSPLPNEGRLQITFANRNHVTVVRRRVAAGERVAFTTLIPLSLNRDGFTLVVFQESFRLLDPTNADGGQLQGDPAGDPGGGD